VNPPVAIVTGAARGIGAATARRLHAAGWCLTLVDVAEDDPALDYPLASPEELHALAAELDAHPVVADVREQAALDAAVAATLERYGRLDAAVAAAGAVTGGPFAWETDDAKWAAMIDINLTGPWRLARAALPVMLAAGSGRYVAVASVASAQGIPRLAAYSAAKHGLVGLVRSLAAELGPSGLTANAVLPGSTRTDMLEASADVYDLPSAEEFGRHHRIERLVEPDEIAAVVAWLCTDAPLALTGAVVPVDGGMTAS
jgi:SDR family mycofactocin-dependent oxidoreductase